MTSSAFSRRNLLKYGLSGAACAACGGCNFSGYIKSAAEAATEVFKNDAPQGELWDLWQRRGWVQEARHYVKLGRNLQCRLCPNKCLLEPEDRGRCRNRVHKDGTLYTLAYANGSVPHLDPVEKKPLFHFLPGSTTLSFATTGCGFRCLNCQNWDISQRKPEELKDPRGESVRLEPRMLHDLSLDELNRLSPSPDDIVAVAEHYECPSVSYTYSEPTVWFEYMIDTAKAARAKNLKNIWVTCGYIQEEPLVELCQYIDAAHVDLKGFREETYQELNSGKLAPILDTLKTLAREGVWFEVINLVVPTYTDKLDVIREMCRWLVDNLGPDRPLHFSQFKPMHKLTQLPMTSPQTLKDARAIAREEGLRYVYIGNCPEIADAAITLCPGCQKAIVDRSGYSVHAVHVVEGKCKFCGQAIAGVWK